MAPFQDPVLASDDRVYERKAILQHLRNHTRSPVLQVPMPSRQLVEVPPACLEHLCEEELSLQDKAERAALFRWLTCLRLCPNGNAVNYANPLLATLIDAGSSNIENTKALDEATLHELHIKPLHIMALIRTPTPQ